MQIEEELSRVLPQKEMMLTIGTFDGVHIGHKYLIAQLRAHAKSKNLLSGVITFKHNPKIVVNPQLRIMPLTSIHPQGRPVKTGRGGLCDTVVLYP